MSEYCFSWTHHNRCIYTPIAVNVRMLPYLAYNLLNNGVVELAIPNTHFPQPASCAVFMFSSRGIPKKSYIVV